MLLWQSVVVDKSEHSGDRRSAKDVCHEKSMSVSSTALNVHPSDTSATATATTTATKTNNNHNKQLHQHIDDTFVVTSP